MSTVTSGLTGKPLVTTDPNEANVVFAATDTAATVKVLTVNPASAHALFLAVAGNTNIKLEATSDSPHAIASGTANYAAAKTYTATAVGGYLGQIKRGVTAVRITQSKEGTGTDDAAVVARLGGRSAVRATPVSDDFAGDTGIGAYTELASGGGSN